MKSAKNLIDMAFKQSMHLLSERFGIGLYEMTLLVNFIGTKIELTVCANEVPRKKISLESFVGSKMVGIRLSAPEISDVLRSVQYAFSNENKLNNFDRLSLILYDSRKANRPCMGVFIDDIPQKTLVISDILGVLGIGAEQSN